MRFKNNWSTYDLESGGGVWFRARWLAIVIDYAEQDGRADPKQPAFRASF